MSIESLIQKAVSEASQAQREELQEMKALIKELSSLKPLKFYTIDQVAEMLEVDRKTVDNWRREGKLAYSKAGSLIRIQHEDLMSFLSSHKRR